MIIVKDTETTGLPIWGEPSEGENQPHIVQLAALLIDPASREVMQELDVIIRPDGWVIPDEVAAIHGITTERAMDEGIPEQEAVEQYLELWRQAELRVGHNISFDDRILRIALKRYFDEELCEQYKNAEKFCTGHKSKGILQIPAKNRRWGPHKMPTLQEAYKHFTGEDLEGAHSAMADTKGCVTVYWGILDHEQAQAAESEEAVA